jgi:hypothetical protein
MIVFSRRDKLKEKNFSFYKDETPGIEKSNPGSMARFTRFGAPDLSLDSN